MGSRAPQRESQQRRDQWRSHLKEDQQFFISKEIEKNLKNKKDEIKKDD